MKATILACAALFASLFVTVGGSAQVAEILKPGDAMPLIETPLKSVDGRTIRMADAMGQNGLLVMFSCNTCPFVVRNQAVTRQTMEYAKAHHVGMIIINSNEAQRGDADSYEAMKKYASEQGYTVPYVMDANSEIANKFGANHTPEVFLFGKNNQLIYKGAMNDNPSNPGDARRAYVQDAIDAMIAGKTVDPNSTKSIGCSIKRKA